MKFTIDSAAVRDGYMRDIVTRTINDISGAMSTVFGPYASDAYIHKNGHLYYTRDGKEVLSSISYDNVISNDVLKIIYQAVERQAALVGDGTTTLAVLYTNIYQAISKDPRFHQTITTTPLNWLRDMHKEVSKELCDILKEKSIPMSDEYFYDMLYTCTQDAELTELIHDRLGDAVKEQAYMVIEKSNIDDALEIEVHNEPLILAEKIYSTYNVPLDSSLIDNSIIMYVDGALDISSSDTLVNLAQLTTEEAKDDRPNIIILCTGTTQVTRNCINEFQSAVSRIKDAKLNNIIIVKILNSLDYNEDMKEDLIAYLYNMIGISGAVNAITFEALLHQAFSMTSVQTGEPIERFMTFDFDPESLDVIRNNFFSRRSVSFAPGKGMRIYGDMSFVAKTRYDELVDQIETEKSEVTKVALKKRLRTVYGKFIQVRVGSTLIKDSQRKYELILDAIKSSMDAYKNGILRGNSIIYTALALDELKSRYADKVTEAAKENKDTDMLNIGIAIIECLRAAIKVTICQLLHLTEDFYDSFIETTDVSEFTIHNDRISETISGRIVEPLDIMTMILKHSIVPIELYAAKLFCVDSAVRNYI